MNQRTLNLNTRYPASRVRAAQVLVAAVLASTASFGCGETVRFNVLRPSKINVRKIAGDAEPTVSVGQWGATDGQSTAYANEVGQYLRELVVSAEGGVVKFTENGGAVTLNGTLSQHEASDQVTSKTDKCTKTDSNGKSYESSCTYYTRKGRARVRVSLNVLDSAGTTVAADTSSCEVERSTYATDEQPAEIDWDGILLSCRKRVATELAKNVVPYRVVVAKPWFDCGNGNDYCKAGLNQLRAANFDQALAQFNHAHELVKSGDDNDAKAAVEWALALTCEFSGDYEVAEQHIQKAIGFNPSEEVYASEVAAIRQEEAQAQALASQGVH